MNNLRKNLVQCKTNTGFSMIDVLVSIVVLATAMLALAALQGALTRNAADARSRTQIVSFLDGALDQLRSSGYGNISFSSSQNTKTTTINASTTCSSLTGAEKTICNNRSAVQTAAGVSNLVTTITYKQYAKTSSTNSNFTLTSGSPDTSSGAYKQVNLAATWTDASGVSRKTSLDTIISYTLVNTGDNTLVTNQPPPATSAIAPTVRQYNPGATAGVIPIAIGSSDTAATNPKPEVLGSKNSLTSVGVQFNVLTYQSPDANNEAIIQKNVDTKVITCSCKYGGGVSADSNLGTVFAQPYRPTYWDGTHYVSPDKASGTTSSTGVDSASTTNDDDCDICCRDRNDSPSDTIKFDPFSGVTTHYQYVNGTLTPVSSGTYVNACRLIRVDGIYTTATDLRNYFFNLLGTDSAADTKVPSSSSSTQPASSPIPADSPPSSFAYVTDYQNFIKAYLNDSITSFKSGSTPAAPASSPLTTPTNAATGDYAAKAPINPSNINITYSASGDNRYLHARGLYIDYLQQPAIDAIKNAYDSCPSASTKADCVLPHVPFTTINLTELADWQPDVSNVITVYDNAITANGVDYFQNPLRGIVTVFGSSVANGATANARATIGPSNSGLNGVLHSQNWAISLFDENNTLTDQQLFTVSNAGGGGGGTGNVYFDVTLTGLAWLNSAVSPADGNVGVSWSATAAQLGGTAGSGTLQVDACKASGTDATYYGSSTTKGKSCTNSGAQVAYTASSSPSIPPVGTTITVQGYNNASPITETVTCSDGTGSSSVTSYQCMDYAIDTTNISVNSTPVSGATVAYTNGGCTSESAAISLPSLITSTSSSTPDLIKIGFSAGSVVQTFHGTCKSCVTKGNKTTCSVTNATASQCPASPTSPKTTCP